MKFTYLADLPADLADDISRSYPLLCHPLRATYISRPDMLGTPEMDKREQEDLFLSRFIMDKHLWNMYKKYVISERKSHLWGLHQSPSICLVGALHPRHTSSPSMLI